MIVIVDYGAGNVASVKNMLRKVGHDATISARPEDVQRADKIVLPGVGHFDHGMRELEARGLREALDERVFRGGAPCLGICLGAQLIARRSEEGELPGLAWVDADVKRFDEARLGRSLRVPHMGWTTVSPAQSSGLFAAGARFYFVHAYHLVCDHDRDVLAHATHGYRFVAAVRRENVTGVQFHPEKSHRFGMHLLAAFARGELD